jgi:DNA-binding CsgD family transcriptional regulator
MTEIDNLRAAFTFSHETGDIDHALQLASSLLPLWLTRGHVREGWSWLHTALATADPIDPAVHARALADKTVLDAWMGDYHRTAQAQRAVSLARDIGDPALLALTLGACGYTRCWQPVTALPYVAQAIDLARGTADRWRLSQYLSWQAFAAFVAGDPALGIAAAEEGQQLADSLGDGFVSRQCRWCKGLALSLRGHFAASQQLFTDVVTEAATVNDALYLGLGILSAARAQIQLGEVSAARVVATAAIEASAGLYGLQQVLCLGIAAEAALADADVPAAVEACDQARTLADENLELAAAIMLPAASVALARGDLEQAGRWADDAVAVALGAHRVVALSVRIRVARARGTTERAHRDAYDALAIAANTQAYAGIPDTLECLAQIAAENGSHREAAKLLGYGQAIRAETGQSRFAIYESAHRDSLQTTRNSLGEPEFDALFSASSALSPREAITYALRGRGPRKRPASGWDALTPTEREVARLAGEGLANKEIGARLFISPRTVQTHLTHVYAKLGVSSRIQLAQHAERTT